VAEFLTTHGTAFQLERIINGARAALILVSPYLRLSKTLLERLQDASRRGVRITLIYGKSSLARDEEAALSQLNRLSIHYFENLHAKCYANEEHLVITSMNLHEFSEKTNREMGVLFSKNEQVYRDAMAEIQSILAASSQGRVRQHREVREAPPDPPGVVRSRRRQRPAVMGACIRCAREIPQNPSAPY
jgi:phosphatidylserine/phosphatidylglycerophosphate/cardiolipin synthase-like enzyme